MKLIIKGGKGSGNFGHSGRPGQVGGSDTSGVRMPEGYSKDTAYQYAEFILNHVTGSVLPESLNDFDNDIWGIIRGETIGHWAAETIDKVHIDDLITNSPDHIVYKTDRAKLEEIAKLSSYSDKPGMPFPYKIVMESSGKTDLDEDKLGEWGITSPYQLRPVNLAAVGWWEHNNNAWTIHIAKDSLEHYGVSNREVFWHEFGHTLSSNIIEHFIGKPGPMELSGEYMDRFAQYMSKH